MGLRKLASWRDRQEELPTLADKYEGHCLVVGGGHTVWTDLDTAYDRNADVMCVNDIAMHFPAPIHHMYSNHANQLPVWHQARNFRLVTMHNKEDKPAILHSFRPYQRINVWPLPGHGTSSLNAVYTALALGYERVTVCGVPLDNEGYYFSPPEALRETYRLPKWSNFLNEVPDRDFGLRDWTQAARMVFDGRVRIVSGRARGLSA